jgi:hypothetical protein
VTPALARRRMARREGGATSFPKPTSNAATPGWIARAGVTYFQTGPKGLTTSHVSAVVMSSHPPKLGGVKKTGVTSV